MMKFRLQIPEQEYMSFADSEGGNQDEIIVNTALKFFSDRFVRRIAYALQTAARYNAPYRTGNLWRHIGVQKKGEEWFLVASAFYSPYVEFGTGIYREKNPGYIYPKNGKFLVFRSGGKMIFARRIKGQKGQHYMRDALDNMGDAIEFAWENL